MGKSKMRMQGSSKRRGCVTLAETYSSSLEQSSSRVFWVSSAINNHIVIGADASNAFEEATPPKSPFYV